MLHNKQSSLYSGIIDYFSAPNFLDVFNLGDDFSYDNSQIKLILNYSPNLTESNIPGIRSWDNNFTTNFLDYKVLFSDSIFLNLSYYISDIRSITPINSNLDDLITFFPERTIHFENFEISNLELDEGVFEALSTPDLKLFYPEPFIASPSFVHGDMWFLHVLHFQHWLWFFFISLIMLFFITFINVVRWYNICNKPEKGTRGVSRSRCADMITACVPVS